MNEKNEQGSTVLHIPILLGHRSMLDMTFEDEGLFRLYQFLEDVGLKNALEFLELMKVYEETLQREDIADALHKNGINDPISFLPDMVVQLGQQFGLEPDVPLTDEEKLQKQKKDEQQLVKFSYRMLVLKRYRNRVDVARLASRVLGRRIEPNTWTQRVNRWAKDRLPKVGLRNRSHS